MTAAMSGVTFAVDPVAPGTAPLPTERLKASVEKLLGSPIEACDSYSANVVAQPGFHSLVAAADLAYRHHYPLVLTPDAIWITIAQGFARHVANNAEELRPLLVRHEGKVKLSVRRDDFVNGSPENPWQEVWPEFCTEIRRHIGDDAHRLVVCDFSTTGPAEKAASEIVLMDAVQSYFDYRLITLCGIPSVRVEGTPGDWEGIRARAARLAAFGLHWWTERLLAILDQFVHAARRAPTPAFWRSMYKQEGGSGGPFMSGWLIRLLPYLAHREYRDGRFEPRRTDLRNPMLERPLVGGGRRHGLTHDQLPSSVSAVPFQWRFIHDAFDYEFLAGVTAITQDAGTLAVRPRVGWAVRPTPAGPPRSIWDA